jgi:Putative oxalocrotonate tautomerase enzyme
MPLYDIEHICPLTDVQQDAIAAAITKIHTEKFIVPTMFVNVYFRNVSDMTAYVGSYFPAFKLPTSRTHSDYTMKQQIGGKRRKTNKIFCHLRGGGDRKITQFNEVTHELVDMWNSIVKNETEGVS